MFGVESGSDCASLLELWLGDMTLSWAPKTLGQRRFVVRTISASIGALQLKDVTQDHLLALRRELFASGCSRSWQSAVRAVTAQFFSWCQDRRYLDVSPYRPSLWRLPKDKHDTSKYRAYSHEEIDVLLTRLPKAVGAFVLGACLLGWRKKSLYSLQWEHVGSDWWCRLPPEFVKQGKELVAYIPPRLQEWLSPRGQGSELVFKGLPTECHLNKVLKRAAKKAGLDPARMHPHQMRRTWCTWFKAAGGTREEAMQVQGWSSDHVCLAHYWPTVSASRQSELARKL